MLLRWGRVCMHARACVRVRVFVYVFVHVISSIERVCASVRVCVCVCVCARVQERMHVCLYVTLFCFLLKWNRCQRDVMCVCVRIEHVCICACLLPFSALFWNEVLMRWGRVCVCMCTCLCMWHLFLSGVRLKFLFFREVKRFCFEDAYEFVRLCVCVCVCAICVCVCACACARVSEHVCCMCACPLLFSALLKRSANALRACVRVLVYMSAYVACFVFKCEVKISVLSWSDRVFLLRGCVWMRTCLCVCVCNMCVCVLVCAREWERASERVRMYVGYCVAFFYLFLKRNMLMHWERERVCVCVHARACERVCMCACALHCSAFAFLKQNFLALRTCM